MKNYFLITAASLVTIVSALVSCSEGGNEPTGSALTLKPSKTEIVANGTDRVAFNVIHDGTDVTSTATIWQLAGSNGGTDTKLAEAAFSTTVPGTYKFKARYEANGENLTSPQETITATGSKKEKFFRRIFAQQFTSTTCIGCPVLSTVLAKVEESDAWNDRLVRASFHTNYVGEDPMTISIASLYLSHYNQNSLPSLYLDLRPDTHETSIESKIVTRLEQVLADYAATCGVAIESSYDKNSKEVNFTVKVTASESNQYRVLPFLTEDHIIGYQVGGKPENEYEHNHVVRYAFSMSLLGDKLGEQGTIEAGQEATKTYKVTLANDWKPENMHVVVCVLSADGKEFYGNNSATCPLNGSVQYKYNAE